MEVQTPAPSRFHQRRAFVLILFIIAHYELCWALKMTAGNHGMLDDVDQDELDGAITEIRYKMVPPDVFPSNSYFPNLINTLRYSFSNQLKMVVRLNVWNPKTCNLGLGGEGQVPMVPVLGQTIIDSAKQWGIPSIEDLMRHGLGYGEVIHEGVSIDYFVTGEDGFEQESDDEPSDHEHDELFEVDSRTNSNTGRSGEGKIPLPLSSYNRTSFSHQASSSNVSDHQRLRALQTASGGSLPVSNVTNSTNLPQRKFPIDTNGDCDLASLVLMTSTGPFYDDASTHGLQMLNPTDQIWSPNGRFYLVMQLDCNLVLYDVLGNRALWASGTYNKASSCYCTITTYGELMVVDYAGNALWLTNTSCGFHCWTNTILQVQDDGNLVLYIQATLYPLWHSDTVQCDDGCEALQM